MTIFKNLHSAKIIAVDVETFDPSIAEGKGSGELCGGFICGVSLATDDGFAEYFPVAHQSGNNLNQEIVFNYLNDQLGNKNQIKIGHNVLYDASYLNQGGIRIAGKIFDTQMAEGLIDENRGSQGYSLESIAQKYLKTGKDSEFLYSYLSAHFGGPCTRKHQMQNLWKAPGEIVRDYAISDVVLPLKIFALQKPILESQDLWELFEIETGLIPMILKMREKGVKIDSEKVDFLKRKFEIAVNELEAEIFMLFGKNFNLSSSTQLSSEFLNQGVLGQKTKTGKLSTSKKQLETFKHPAAKKILELREINTLLNTFLKGYCTDHLIKGRLHCHLHPLKSGEGGTVTGRFSCSNPNLQNIPKNKNNLIRELFLPEPGEIWVSDDYSQIEYRLLVHYATGESAAIARQAYCENPKTDYHEYVKNLIESRTCKTFTRRDVKIINFGLMYTKGKKSLAQDLGFSLQQAEDFLKIYHSSLPYISETQRKMAARANSRGYVHTLLKRRRRFDLWEQKYFSAEKPLPFAEAVEKWGVVTRAKTKDALNAVLQGGCADIMKKAMLEIWKSGVCEVLGAPIITVHDELNWSVPQSKAGIEAHQAAVNIMETCVKLSVPLVINTKTGKNWGFLSENFNGDF